MIFSYFCSISVLLKGTRLVANVETSCLFLQIVSFTATVFSSSCIRDTFSAVMLLFWDIKKSLILDFRALIKLSPLIVGGFLAKWEAGNEILLVISMYLSFIS